MTNDDDNTPKVEILGDVTLLRYPNGHTRLVRGVEREDLTLPGLPIIHDALLPRPTTSVLALLPRWVPLLHRWITLLPTRRTASAATDECESSG
ncbi:MAG: hypothetical protein ABF296_04485 [Oceanococcaceae bacterium]